MGDVTSLQTVRGGGLARDPIVFVWKLTNCPQIVPLFRSRLKVKREKSVGVLELPSPLSTKPPHPPPPTAARSQPR